MSLDVGFYCWVYIPSNIQVWTMSLESEAPPSNLLKIKEMFNWELLSR